MDRIGLAKRIVVIWSLLISRKEVKVNDLMERFGRCRQTILNDLTALSEIIPVYLDTETRTWKLSEFIDPDWEKIFRELEEKQKNPGKQSTWKMIEFDEVDWQNLSSSIEQSRRSKSPPKSKAS